MEASERGEKNQPNYAQKFQVNRLSSTRAKAKAKGKVLRIGVRKKGRSDWGKS